MTPIRRLLPLLVAAALPAVARPQAVPPVAPARPTGAERVRVERAAALEMFARAYYPGRSGQIMVVPREGDILTRPGGAVPSRAASPGRRALGPIRHIRARAGIARGRRSAV